MAKGAVRAALVCVYGGRECEGCMNCWPGDGDAAGIRAADADELADIEYEKYVEKLLERGGVGGGGTGD